MPPSDHHSKLSLVLRSWILSAPRDPQFRSSVWARIEARGRTVSWPVYLRGHAAALAGALAVVVAIGGWVGREQAQARVAADREQIAQSYVQSLDARTLRP
jgi:hypothetical protein